MSHFIHVVDAPDADALIFAGFEIFDAAGAETDFGLGTARHKMPHLMTMGEFFRDRLCFFRCLFHTG